MNRKSVYRVRIENPKTDGDTELFFSGWSKDNVYSQVKSYMAINRIDPTRKVEVFDF